VSESAAPVVLVYWGRRGGGARYTYEIARAFTKLADRRTVVSLNADNELLPLFRQLPGEHLTLDIRTFSGTAAWPAIVPGPWSFGQWCRRGFGADARVIVTMGNPLSFPLAIALRSARMSFTHVVHDAVPHPGEASQLMMRSVRWACRLALHVVCLSEPVRAQIISDWGIRAERTSVVPHAAFYADEALQQAGKALTAGADTADSGNGGSGRPFNVLFLGRIVAYKGIGLLLDAWAEVQGTNPRDRPLHLTIAGEGDLSAWRAQIAAAPSLTVDNRWLSDARIVDLVRTSDLVVLPYLEASQSGVIGIAHAFHVPVVCTNVGGLGAQADRANGDTVVPPDVRALAQAIRNAVTRTTGAPGTLPRVTDPSAPDAIPTWRQTALALAAGLGAPALGRAK
jgi:glycosyltransferase involved in cell wall biosynthesis